MKTTPGSDALVVAIDGPSGVGKSTVARLLARRLRVPVLDTGAMYRTVALEALRTDTDPDDAEALAELVETLDLDLRADSEGEVEILLDGVPVGGRIRTAEVTEAASRVSVHPAVRRQMVELQRRAAERRGGVLEGRDIGTVVFPDTPYKFFLTASPEVRAERRHRELLAAGKGTSLDEVMREITERDRRDSDRTESPLRQTDEHYEIDTSDLEPSEIVERMVGRIRRLQEAERRDAGTPAADPTDAGRTDAVRENA